MGGIFLISGRNFVSKAKNICNAPEKAIDSWTQEILDYPWSPGFYP
jgi:hypothetical protein